MKKVDYSKKNKSSNGLYMKDGQVCGDMEATGTKGKNAGSGPKVGGTPMAASDSFAKGQPNAGKWGITATPMPSNNPTPMDKSTFSTITSTNGNPKSAGESVIAPKNMASNNTIGVK